MIKLQLRGTLGDSRQYRRKICQKPQYYNTVSKLDVTLKPLHCTLSLEQLITRKQKLRFGNVRFISNLRLTSASTGLCYMSRISWLSQKHANFVRFSYFSCIPFVSLSFLPLVYKTSIYKLYLKAIIKIFRSGFLDFLLAIQPSRRDVFITF